MIGELISVHALLFRQDGTCWGERTCHPFQLNEAAPADHLGWLLASDLPPRAGGPPPHLDMLGAYTIDPANGRITLAA